MLRFQFARGISEFNFPQIHELSNEIRINMATLALAGGVIFNAVQAAAFTSATTPEEILANLALQDIARDGMRGDDLKAVLTTGQARALFDSTTLGGESFADGGDVDESSLQVLRDRLAGLEPTFVSGVVSALGVSDVPTVVLAEVVGLINLRDVPVGPLEAQTGFSSEQAAVIATEMLSLNLISENPVDLGSVIKYTDLEDYPGMALPPGLPEQVALNSDPTNVAALSADMAAAVAADLTAGVITGLSDVTGRALLAATGANRDLDFNPASAIGVPPLFGGIADLQFDVPLAQFDRIENVQEDALKIFKRIGSAENELE